MEKIIVGALEQCALPDLGISDVQVRVDTGAKTSSLHVDNLKKFLKDGKPWVSFDIHPDIYEVEKIIQTQAELVDIRKIKSSNGTSEQRYIIETDFKIGQNRWPIEISLTDRSDMNYLMLLGRQGMQSRVLVDPGETYVISQEPES